MDGRTIDKRKARDKETDSSEVSNTSLLNKNPMKRPRVEYSSAEEKSPTSKPLLTDSLSAATPAAPLTNKSDHNSNGDASVAPTTDINHDPSVISKFDLPAPLTTQELEQKIGKSEGTEDNDSDDGSTKFLSDVIQNEENRRKRQVKGKTSNDLSESQKRSNGTSTATNSSSPKRNAGTSTKQTSTGKNMHQPTLTSSPISDLVINSNEVEITMRIVERDSRRVMLEETIINSDFQRVDAFLRQHNVKIPAPSQTQSSGYSGDISNFENSNSPTQDSSKSSSGNSRWTMSSVSSLGSTIPRQSIVSIATDISDSPEELMKRPVRPVSKARKRSDGPLLSSTKIDDNSSSTGSALDRMNVSSNPLSNGDQSSSSLSASGKSQTPANNHSKKKRTQSNSTDADDGLAVSARTPTSSVKKNNKTLQKESPATVSSQSIDSGIGSGKKPAPRRRGGSANFPSTNTQPPELSAVLCTPPPARSVATIEGTQAKPISKFEQDMNREPIVESELEKSETLWSTILPTELVFARWRDKNYYSGMVKSKGLNDTWNIDFDDGMSDVASETHIIPLRILGVGIRGVYCPDDHYEAKPATIIGQKFEKDEDTGETVVKYAIKFDGDNKPIWCSRRQLSIKEAEAKKLRPEYLSIIAGKPGDVSLDNIVSGPRRRIRGGGSELEEPGPSHKVASDENTTDEKPSTSTPKSRGTPKSVKKTPMSDVKKKRVGNVGTPQTKPEGAMSPAKETVGKESPSRVAKSIVAEPSKKKSKKFLFQGMQFLLTASGGGDPGISGTPIIPPIPYDKDEYRELIESCGGEILDTVGNEQKENVFLISDSYARTVKYIYCMAAGIPCVSHSWIKQCLDNNEIVEWKVFILPAGWSIELQDLVQHHVRKPLKGCKVFVTSESDQLYNYWKPVLTAAEAVLLKLPRKKGSLIPSGTEVVVTDYSDATPGVVVEAKSLSVPVVKPEWLVQTIITGEKALICGHDKYRIDITETEDNPDFGSTHVPATDGGTNVNDTSEEVSAEAETHNSD